MDEQLLQFFSIFLICFVGPTNVNSQNTAISLKTIHFFDKIKPILYPQVRNSITQQTLTYIICNMNIFQYANNYKKPSDNIDHYHHNNNNNNDNNKYNNRSTRVILRYPRLKNR